MEIFFRINVSSFSSKKIRDWDPRRLASSLFSIENKFWFRRRLATGITSLALLIPFFAKNSHLGYFLNAKNLERLVIILKFLEDLGHNFLLFWFIPRIFQCFRNPAPPLRGSRRTIATVVAHREPWGVKNLEHRRTWGYEKVKEKKFQKNNFLILNLIQNL